MSSSTRPFITGFERVAPATWNYVPFQTGPGKSLNRPALKTQDSAIAITTMSSASSTFSTYSLASSSAPSLILLFPWTGATPRPISKYTAAYQALYPTTPIVVITTTIKDLCYRSSSTKQKRIQPALHYVHSAYHNISKGGILLHAFSEGGLNKAIEFAEAWKDRFGEKLDVRATYLDSTPGHPRFSNLCNAFAKTLPRHSIIRGAGLVLGCVTLGGCWILYSCIKGYEENVISKSRRRINDDLYWDLSRPRCYLYSQADDLISWEDVHEHATEAMGNGIPVFEICFQESGHCDHARQEPEAYWNAVQTVWKESRIDMEEKGIGIAL